MERFKRNQLEQAICEFLAGKAGRSRPELLTRIKRLLDTDRGIGRDRRSMDPKREYAFFSGDPSGSGVEVWFQGYEAFALLLALNLLDHGFPQQSCVEVLRHLRPALEVEHGRILRRKPATPFDQEASHASAKPGQIATRAADPVFIGISYASEGRGEMQYQGSVKRTQICRGERQAMKFITSRKLGEASTIIEIAAALRSFHPLLLKTKPRQRGRTAS